jgi:site-specific DNA recombinase
MSTKPLNLSCAIYTRKSSEEGLEQGFNSLDAQREACEAFVLSQQHEGWRALETLYDDGGYSGGTIVRPALQRLLEDIDKKRIKVVVVYKVDRLTRSLADFAKIVERFDAKGVSFVSVTQQFNTTSSMGRLTLNVLLSFAQFEREVTSERIRDKIAASKQKGMWMGGTPPIGYLGNGRTLKIDELSTNLIRHLYERYLVSGSVRELKQELDTENIVTPHRVSNAGKAYGGQRFSRGQLYRILVNPVYLGKIVHRDNVYPGQHLAIIDQALWDTVQTKIVESRQGHQQLRSVPSVSLLTGLIVDAQGDKLIPSHSQKKSKRYRYYVSEKLIKSLREHSPDGMRLPSQEVETLVINALHEWLSDPNAVLKALDHPDPSAIQNILAQANRIAKVIQSATDERYRLVRTLIHLVKIEAESVQITINASVLYGHSNPRERHDLQTVMLNLPIKIRRCGLATRILIKGTKHSQRQEPDARLIQLIAKAHDWLGRLTSGNAKNVMEIAIAEGVSSTYVTRVIYRAFLAPDIVRAILSGTQPPTLTLDTLKKNLPLPIDWDEQRKLLDFKS